MCDDECGGLSWALGCLCPLSGLTSVSRTSSVRAGRSILSATPPRAACFSPVSLLASSDQWCELENGPAACFVFKSGTVWVRVFGATFFVRTTSGGLCLFILGHLNDKVSAEMCEREKVNIKSFQPSQRDTFWWHVTKKWCYVFRCFSV